MEAWSSILLAISGNTVVLGVLGYLSKSLIEKFLARESKHFESNLARDVKQFEIELKAKADVTADRLRNELQLRTIEHQVRFSKLHEKRAEVIAELYRRLRTALWDAESFLSPMQFAGEPEQPEKYATARNSLVDAYRYFGEHQIYLPHELCVSLEKLIADTRQEVIRLGVWIGYKDEHLPDHAQKNKYEVWMEAWDRIKKEIPLATHALEEEFRALLGADLQSYSNRPTGTES